MKVSKSLRRLLELREMEEEQSRLALEAALADLNRLEHALQSAHQRSNRSRQLIRASAITGELPDRIAALEECRAAARIGAALEAAILTGRRAIEEMRLAHQALRVKRLQVETLVREAQAIADTEDARRNQQALDDWYGSRGHAGSAVPRSAKSTKS
jgi:flagellar biosynthesis chaperone FliJ